MAAAQSAAINIIEEAPIQSRSATQKAGGNGGKKPFWKNNKGKQSGGDKRPNLPKTIPKPQNLELNKNPTQPRDDPIWKESVFGVHAIREEVDPRVLFQNNYASYLRVVDTMLAQYQADNPKLSYSLTPELIRYYATGLLWLRLIELKILSQQNLTIDERALRTLTENITYHIPEPIYLYLRAIGPIETVSGQHIYPTSPPLPTNGIAAVSGLFGAIDENDAVNAILYTEYPTLGLASEAIQASLVQPNFVAQYHSVIELEGHIANPNALGYYPVAAVSSEIRRSLAAMGITAIAFRETVLNTRFCIELMEYVSTQLSVQKTFKITTTVTKTLAIQGSTSQTTIERPSDTNNDATLIATALRVDISTMEKHSLTSTGVASAYTFQLFKEAVGADPPPADERRPRGPVLNEAALAAIRAAYDALVVQFAQLNLQPPPPPQQLVPPPADAVVVPHRAHKNWLPLTYADADPAPAIWVEHRNDRRDLPPRYMDAVFTGKEVDPSVLRMLVTKSLVSTSRG